MVTQIARDMMSLCLKELFDFRFMQTDPNWSNFFYNVAENKVCFLYCCLDTTSYILHPVI